MRSRFLSLFAATVAATTITIDQLAAQAPDPVRICLAPANVAASSNTGAASDAPGGRRPHVEAGTMASGRGIVRVGPQYECNPVKPSTPVIGIPGFEDRIVGKVRK